MKKLIAAFLLYLCSNSIAAADVEYFIGVDGLACPFCSYGIEKQLRKLDGVADLEIDLAQGLVKIRMDEGKTLSEGEVEMAVEKAGFKLRSFSPAQ